MSVRIENLVRTAPGNASKVLLDGVSLDVPDGSFMALVGPSGAGKTTLLRAIAGLDAFQSGSVVIDERDATGLSARDRNIGFVFQNYALFRNMTVARNISFGLDVMSRSQRPPQAEIDRRVQELLDLIHLPDMGGVWPQRLSGGQRQRVALARALATRPRHLLLDEPFGALDPVVRRSVREWLRALHDQLGLTTILVTHDHEEALDVSDRLVVMQDGRIVQDAGPDALEARPATPFVMEFLGETLKFAGQVSGGMFIPADPHVARFSVPGVADGEIIALIRPHEVRITSAVNGAPARKVGLRYGFARLAVDMGDRVVDILSATPWDVGESVELHIDAARLFRNGRMVEERCDGWA
ncbi:nitrate/sulfonate/bicarbonate transporter ATP-binding protein [Acetobacter estunensis NRIC 0472]|uniref:ATP-binding cassette domain-containing protein n=1 Tax=Acetobacter estunensis TaxID=104097 RepID=A0A967EBR1_9PROT|nr:ATP-binding cassette domain-containing protein [Acetobacter estunensis]NHO53753.1 ATP-binding cassette domain-containing protein [Acetobacter estunensis]GBQ20158.1 nitrate/sulfonate/bicarbonate transporter ATP-binding protein [Acetobacter estunensis NRIC 0472]